MLWNLRQLEAACHYKTECLLLTLLAFMSALYEIRSTANRKFFHWFLVKLCANSLPLNLYKCQPTYYSPRLRGAREVLYKKKNKIRAFSSTTADPSLICPVLMFPLCTVHSVPHSENTSLLPWSANCFLNMLACLEEAQSVPANLKLNFAASSTPRI